MDEKKYIDRDKLVKVLEDCTSPNVCAFLIEQVIDCLPAEDVAPVVHGEWLRVSDDDQYEGEYCCSVCNAEEFFPENAPFAPFCWKCGAKMDGGAR